MMRHVVVRNRDGRGSVYGIDESIVTIRQRAMIDPNVFPAENRHAVTVGLRPPPCVARGVSNVPVPGLLTVVYVDSMDDDVGDVMYGDAWSISNVNTCTSTVYGLERVHDQLLLQLDHHVPLENDPQRLVLYHGVSDGSGPRVHRVVVAGVGYYVDSAVSPANCVFAEADGAIGQALAVFLPIGVAPPAVVYRVATSTRGMGQLPPRRTDIPAEVQCRISLELDEE